MQIQVNTDKHIEGGAELTRKVEEAVRGALDRFGARITRVEIHFSDESSSAKSGDRDKRCVMEARLSGLQPISVSHHAGSVELALDGAAGKMEKMLDRTLERLHDPKGRTPYGGEPTP
jgi:ribosome-associated translation inhibitor RaiA